jgi:hypothetical protein
MMEPLLEQVTDRRQMETQIFPVVPILLDVIPVNVVLGILLLHVEELMMQQHAMLLMAVIVQDHLLLLLLLT